MKVNKKICIMILTGIYIFFISIFNVKALQYTIDINIKNQINLGANLTDKFFIPDNVTNPEFVLDINKTITCDTSICLTSIPLTLSSFSSTAFNGNGSLVNTWEYMGMYAQLWGSSPNYSCTYSNGALDCPITNGQELKKIEIFVGQKNMQTQVVDYSRGAFINVYNITNVGTSINNIDNKMNEDISQSDKDAPDQTQYNNAKQQEDNIINSISNVNANDITFNQDLNATNKIWDTTTRFLQTNAKVMGLVISILSIGIIKLIMNR